MGMLDDGHLSNQVTGADPPCDQLYCKISQINWSLAAPSIVVFLSLALPVIKREHIARFTKQSLLLIVRFMIKYSAVLIVMGLAIFIFDWRVLGGFDEYSLLYRLQNSGAIAMGAALIALGGLYGRIMPPPDGGI